MGGSRGLVYEVDSDAMNVYITLMARSHEPGSSNAERTIADAMGATPVLAIRHPGGQITANPPPDRVLKPGDLVLMIGEEDLPSVRRGA